MLMSPPMRQTEPEPHDRPRSSAVLALLHMDGDDISLAFTLRPTSLRHHAGQISFPGGGAEPGDGSCEATALRETAEELGIPTHDIHILGEMTPLFIAGSQNIVHPYVGWMPVLPLLCPDPAEVDRVLQVPVRELLEPRTLGTTTWRRNGRILDAPCYRVGGDVIWGATAMILSELLEIIRGFAV